MTKYNLYIEIAETGSAKNPFRESIWDCKNITTREVYSLLRVTLEKWVRILDEETQSRR
jgi:hypothetical protein